MESLTDGHSLKCKSCGYDLRGQVIARCPECGAPFDPIDATGPAFPPDKTSIIAILATYALALTIPALLVMHHAKYASFVTKLNLWMCSISGPAALFSTPGRDWHAALLGIALCATWALMFVRSARFRSLTLRQHAAFVGLMVGGGLFFTLGGL